MRLRRPRAGDAGVPVPGPDLMQRVTGSQDPTWFRESGRSTVSDWEAALARVGASLHGRGRVLDFGCGSGRAERWLRRVGQERELHAVDVDPEAITWASTHLPWAHFVAGPSWPPLPYPDDHFDLIVNHSVFSHLDEAAQDAWLRELARVAATGAPLLLSVHGAHAFAEFCRARTDAGIDVSALQASYRRPGFVYVADDGMTGPFPDYYHTAFHAPVYLEAHWAEFFDVCSIVERGALDYQDVVVLRARGDESPALR